MVTMSTHTFGKSLLALGGVLFSTISAHAQLQVGLLNYWPLDGNADDSALNITGATGTTSDNGMVNGTVSFSDASIDGLGAGFGQVGNFSGTAGDNITIADPSAGTDDIDRSGADLSISVWVKANQWSTGWQAIIAHGEGADYRIARRGSNDPVNIAYAGGVGDIETGTTYGAAPAGDGLWHHIVATTGNGTVTQLYVDGILEATGGAPTIAASGANNNLLCIGCNPDNGREFNGLIDDIAMWDRVITAQEVTDIHAAGLAGNSISSLFPAPGDDDNDGLPNAWETLYGLDPNDDGSGDINNGPAGDFDSDNVTNLDEFNNNTFPNDDDSDDDTLTDDVETNNGDNSYVSATDTGTNPLNEDSDGDGLSDGEEDNGGSFVSDTQTGSNPTVADTDADTMPDGYEVTNLLDPNTDDGALDPDTDDLDNGTEFGLGTDPQVADSDMDGLNDGVEVNTHETDPLNTDSDGDTLTDGAEVNDHETDPNSTDSDGDLFTDDEEIAEGTDPNDENSKPVVPDLPEPLLYYQFDVEDGTVVENLGSLETAGTLQGGATYGDGQDASFGTAFVGNRDDLNDGFVATEFPGDDLGFGAGSTYTAMAWINWAGTLGNGDHMVFGQDDGAGNQAQLHHGIRDDSAPNNIHFGGWGGAQDVSDAGAVPVGEWTHVAWQYDGADKVVYVNGIESTRAAGNNITNSALNVIIGAHGRDSNLDPAPGNSFNGSLDEVKIYGSALTEAQVRAAMVPGAGSGSAGLEVRSIKYNVENDTVTLTFTSRPGRSYSLLWSADMQDGPDYNEVDDEIDADAVENITTYSFPAPNPGGPPIPKAFFFLRQN